MDKELHQSSDSHFIPMTSRSAGKGYEVTADVYYYTNQIVNLAFIGLPGSGDWVLVDAGMPASGDKIIEVAAARFGAGCRPRAILLTHGHFDHVGGIVRLLQEWEVPVYAHPMEWPYLTGQLAYPEPDPTVEGGLLAKISSIYPHQPVDITPALQTLPADGRVPFLPDWCWIHTPGHAPGQVAFFRERDRLLLSGDAFITVRQDSFYKVLLQQEEVNGPPRYLTTDWKAARQSVTNLQQLHPEMVVPGHGTWMSGAALREGLDRLVRNFEELAVPDYGRYAPGKDKGSASGA